MSTKNTGDGSALLPNGFVDALPPVAQKEAYSIDTLMRAFGAFGYRRIKPPMLEFEESLLTPGPAGQLTSETFRIMDPVSHRMLGVRSDITPQIARIVSSRLCNEPRPLRLMYANDVLRTRGSQMRTERQYTQVGCELVDDTRNIQADVEICLLPLLGLKALSIEDITLDLTIPGCAQALIEQIAPDHHEKAHHALLHRDMDFFQALPDKTARAIADIMKERGEAQRILSVLRDLPLPKSILDQIAQMETLCTEIESALADMDIRDVDITADILEQRGFEYHKGYGFTLYSSQIRAELGRGGAYDIRFSAAEKIETARGFTLYMDTVSQLTNNETDTKILHVPAETPWNDIKRLQNDGWTTVRMIDLDKPPESGTYIYRKNTIEKT